MDKIVLIILVLAITSCSNLNTKTSVDMNQDWHQQGSSIQLFEQWMSSLSEANKRPSKYGQEYYFHIPYYESYGALDYQKKYARPYMNEIDSSLDTFYSLCKKLSGENIRVIEAGRFKYQPYDPAAQRITKRHYPACVTPNEGVVTFKRTVNKSNEYLMFSLYTQKDLRDYMADQESLDKKQREIALNQEMNHQSKVKEKNIAINKQRSQMTKEFRDKLSVGDYSSIGMVVEIKRPIVKIQTASTQKWVKINTIFPAFLPKYAH